MESPTEHDFAAASYSLETIVQRSPDEKSPSPARMAQEKIRKWHKGEMQERGIDITQRVTLGAALVTRVAQRDGLPLARAFFFYAHSRSPDWPIHPEVMNALGLHAEDIDRTADELYGEQQRGVATNVPHEFAEALGWF